MAQRHHADPATVGLVKRSTPLRRTGALLRRTRLRQVSPKRAAEWEVRAAVVAAVVARDGPWCKARLLVPEVACWGPLDPDEYDQRGVRPGGHLDPANVQLLCRAHHDWKTGNEVEAARRGLRPFPRNYTGPDGHTNRGMPL